MSIGRGWYEDDPSYEPDSYSDIRELASGLLKGKIQECFDIARRNREIKNGREMDSKSN